MRAPSIHLFLATCLIACGPSAEHAAAEMPNASVEGAPVLGELTPGQLRAALEAKEFLLVDVHIPFAGVIPGTDTSIPYDQIDRLAGFLGSDLDRKVVLTCLGDSMSRTAGEALLARGYRSVSHLKGGLRAWEAEGYPLQR